MEEKSYNQKQYLRARRHKTKCRYCRCEIIWMKTTDNKNVPVDPLKVINSTPGVRIMGEDGVVLVNNTEKLGWKVHDCAQFKAYLQRKLGSLSIVREQPSLAQASVQSSLF